MDPEVLYYSLTKNSFDFFTGIPDTNISGLVQCIEKFSHENHILVTSEAEAIGVASGHYISSGRFPVVYMQNDGFANALNPVTSLIDKAVFNIPILFIIGWRGHPEIEDAPQHTRMGEILTELLSLLDIKYEILDEENFSDQIGRIRNEMLKKNCSYALLVKKGQINSFTKEIPYPAPSNLKREEAIEVIVSAVNVKTLFIATTGKTARELYEIREKFGQSHQNDLYMVGSMGCAASLGLGIAKNVKDRDIIVLDGDGAILMRLGSLATIGHYSPKNLTHIIIDNNSFDSTGGQKTLSDTVRFQEISQSCGYSTSEMIDSMVDLKRVLNDLDNILKPFLLVLKVGLGSRKDLGRPKITSLTNKDEVMDFLK